MRNKKIYRYTNVELLDAIKNGENRSLVESARTELKKRNLTVEVLKSVEAEYIKFKNYQDKRKDMPLTQEEWITFFLIPVIPRPPWSKDHFNDSENQRFDKYGFDKKAKQATKARVLGLIFWFIVILMGFKLARYLNP